MDILMLVRPAGFGRKVLLCGVLGMLLPLSSLAAPDSDGDGVQNSQDDCPGTNAGVTVDADGCPIGVDLSLASNPLELKVSAEPNVLVVSDDSGSMDASIMIEGVSEGAFASPYRSSHTFWNLFGYNPQYPSDPLTPTQEALDADSDFTGHTYGIWRLRTHEYNTIYYNPDVRYRPWVNYSNSDYTAAKENPLKSTTVDLRSNYNYTASTPKPNGDRKNVSVSVYIPHYYVWTDSDDDGVVDYDDAYTKVEIRAGSTYSGGPDRDDCADSNACTYEEEIQNFANWFTYYRRREFVAKAALSEVIEDLNSVRMGYVTINKTASGSSAAIASLNASPLAGNKKLLLDAIYTTESFSGTPLRQSLRNAGRHFECKSGDIFGSSSDSSPGSSGCPVVAASEGGQCQANYTLLLSDGEWNGSSPSIGDTDTDDDTEYDGDVFGDEGGAISNTLADVAMHYYERDLHTLNDEVPTTTLDRTRIDSNSTEADADTMHQHMKTYTIGIGVNGNLTSMPTNISDTPAWGDPTSGSGAVKIDDLRHAAFNGRGDYFSATNASVLGGELKAVLEGIKASTGTSSALSFNSQNIQNDTKLYRAFFNTKLNTGDVVAHDVATDASIRITIDWSLAAQLDALADPANDRVIFTYDRTAATPTGAPFRYANLNVTQKSVLSNDMVNYLRGDQSLEVGQPSGVFRERPAIGGLLGDIVHSTPYYVGPPAGSARRDVAPYPTDTSDLYSTFKESNKNRDGRVYVGANDGMLHAIDPDTGNEAFAYVPNRLIEESNMLDSLTSPSYTHRYFVDLPPVANDVFMQTQSATPGTLTTRRWVTALVGGLGRGGRGYFALDVTTLTEMDTEANAAKNVLWEFTDKDDGDLGYATHSPLITMSNADYPSATDNAWVTLLGNGYNSDNGTPMLFVLNMQGGLDGDWTDSGDYIKLSTGESNLPDGSKNGLGVPRGIDIDGNGTVDIAYAGDLKGNLYRFDLQDANAANWSVRKIFTAVDSNGNAQPITTRPIVVRNTERTGEYLVIVSTGSWMTSNDATSTDIQSIYGVSDDLASNTSINRSDLVEQSLTNLDDPTLGRVRTLSNNSISWNNKMGWYIDLDVPSISPATGVEYPGERAIRRFVLRSGYIFVNTVFPRDPADCAGGPGGFFLAFDALTGGSGTEAIFDSNNDGVIDSSDKLSGDVIVGTIHEDGTASDGTVIGDKHFSQLDNSSADGMAGADADGDGRLDCQESGGGIECETIPPGAGDKTGRLSWREVD